MWVSHSGEASRELLYSVYFTLLTFTYLTVHVRNLSEHTHTHTFSGPFSRTTWVGRYQKGKPNWMLLKQETVSGSGISWAICKSAPRSRQITMPAPHHSVFFTVRMPFLPPNQQRQSTEGSVRNLSACKCKSKRKPQNIWKIIRLKSLQVRTVSSQSSFVVCFCCICVVKNCGKIKKNSSSVDSLLLLISVM